MARGDWRGIFCHDGKDSGGHVIGEKV